MRTATAGATQATREAEVTGSGTSDIGPPGRAAARQAGTGARGHRTHHRKAERHRSPGPEGRTAARQVDPKAQDLAAIATAQELQRSLPEWSRTWYQHGIIEDPQARVGINTGTVSVGTFGSTVRATYTGIGLQTNIAARVQTEAKPGGILLSNTSWHLVKDEVACEARGEVTVKGVHFPIELYEPV